MGEQTKGLERNSVKINWNTEIEHGQRNRLNEENRRYFKNETS